MLVYALSFEASWHQEFTILLLVLKIHWLWLFNRSVCMPLSSENRTINVLNLSWTFFQVIDKISLINTSISPREHSIALFLISYPLSFIFIASTHWFFPDSLTISQPSLEITFEKASRSPIIFTISRWFTILIVSFIRISIWKVFYSLPML